MLVARVSVLVADQIRAKIFYSGKLNFIIKMEATEQWNPVRVESKPMEMNCHPAASSSSAIPRGILGGISRPSAIRNSMNCRSFLPDIDSVPGSTLLIQSIFYIVLFDSTSIESTATPTGISIPPIS